LLPSALLSHRYPSAHGMVYAYVHSETGVVRYVDPLGGGGAAWRYHVTDLLPGLTLGAACTGATPWAGVQLPGLRFTGMKPFTELDTQVLDYGLRGQAWRADSYDVRFRLASPTTSPGAWKYPVEWQHTSRIEQSLLALTPGVTYCFSVRARDALGAVTDWSIPRCTTRLYDDAALPVSADWTRMSGKAGFYGDTYTIAAVKGATLSIAGSFTRVALVAYHCPTCGSLDIYAGSTLLKTLDLATADGAQELRQWTSPVLPTPATSLTLRVTSINRVVAIDAFGLAR